jgi:hypothetical protein
MMDYPICGCLTLLQVVAIVTDVGEGWRSRASRDWSPKWVCVVGGDCRQLRFARALVKSGSDGDCGGEVRATTITTPQMLITKLSCTDLQFQKNTPEIFYQSIGKNAGAVSLLIVSSYLIKGSVTFKNRILH